MGKELQEVAERAGHRVRNVSLALTATFVTMFALAGGSYADTTDPSGIDVKGTVFDPLKSEFVTVIIPAAAALLVAGIIWHMIRRNGKKAASDA